ncbi:type II toxin-antitoxin system VapC family toxin [Thiocapsa sp.]|uniref:type II toxin-antitoxin system VapC family toxin n=1 Tax=Thiocapsa sp. TaxID=2024551 RepID=UPI0035944158
MMTLIYLDICCFNRPFDDQSQLLIRLQTEAKLFVQDAIRQGVYSLAWSAILDLENIANPDMERRNAIQMWRSLASVNVDTSQRIEALAEQFAKKGIKPMDALHVASAIEAGATWFLTTDHALLRKMRSESRLSVADPVDFIRMLQESNNEN